MSPKRATGLVKEIIVDLDKALASNGKEALDERHSALASAMMLSLRLFGGTAVNIARIATALEKRNELCQVDQEAPKASTE